VVKAVPVISTQDYTFQALQALGPEKIEQLRILLRELVMQFPEGKVAANALVSLSDQPRSFHQ